MLGSIPTELVEVRRVSESVGMGVFTTQAIPACQVVYQDRPLVSIQHTANRRFVKACQNCHKPLGSIRDQFATIFSEERFSHVNLSVLPDGNNVMQHCSCGEAYCSLDCASDAYDRHHYCLCVAGVGEYAQAVSDFKFYCLSIEGCGDNLILLAQLIGTVASRAQGNFTNFENMIGELLTFTNRPFNEVARPPSGAERDSDWQAWLESTIGEAFELMRLAFMGQNEVFARFFENKNRAFDTLSRLLSVFELNNIDISIPSGLGESVRELASSGVQLDPILREKEVVMRALWNDEAKGVYEDDEDEEEDESMDDEGGDDHSGHCHDDHDEDGYVEELLEGLREQVQDLSTQELLDCEYPNFHGTGFFVSVARTNHSCDPNVTMDFESGNAVVSCRTVRPVTCGEELRMSYISNPAAKRYDTRKAQLSDYLFTCVCPLCEAQAPAPPSH